MYTIGGYLYHHGIQGQKWGVRNGPPYPLSAGNRSKAEKEASKKRNISSRDLSSQGGLTNKQKKYIKTGAIVAGVALAAIGTAYLAKSGKLDTLINIGKKSISDDVLKSMVPDSLGFKKIKKPESDEVRLSKCNPNMTDVEKMGVYKSAHNMNCGNSVVANEMRCRGLDVQACGNSQGMTFSQMAQYFDGISSDSMNEPSINVPSISVDTQNKMLTNKITPSVLSELKSRGSQVRDQISKDMLKQYPNGSRGAIMFTSSYGTHWMSWKNVNGEIKFENPQDPGNQLMNNIDVYFGTYVNMSKIEPQARTQCIRLDNLKAKDTLREIVTDFGAADDSGSFNDKLTRGANFVMNAKPK